MRCYEDPIPNKQTQGAKQRKIGEIAHRDHVGCWRAFGFQSRQRFRRRGRNRFLQTDRREDAFGSCREGAESDYQLALGKCDNLSDPAKVAHCEKQAAGDFKDALQLCSEQNALRQIVCNRLGGALYDPKINPSNFVTVTDNPFFPLKPGPTFIYEGQTEDGFEHVEFTVTHKTKVIVGVTCVEVDDTARLDNKVAEDTRDWFAQDKEGNVWYFGENTTLVEVCLWTCLAVGRLE